MVKAHLKCHPPVEQVLLMSKLTSLLRHMTALVLALGFVEGGLRLVHGDLPSLAGVERALLPPGADELANKGMNDHSGQGIGCNFGPDNEPRPAQWTRSFPGEGEAVDLWVAGDSVAMGAGVQVEDSYAFKLGQRLAAQTGRPVKLKNLAVNGGNYCEYLRELDGWLNRETPDLVLLGAFSDDLEHRVMWIAGGEAVGFPGLIADPLLRRVASQSYLANLIWIQVSSRLQPGPRRTVDPRLQEIFTDTFQRVASRVEAAGATWVLSLADPVGIRLCAEDPRVAAECDRLLQDGDLILQLFGQAGFAPLDLRPAWVGQDLSFLEDEVQDLEGRHRLPIHPDGRGHDLLAGALWPSVAAWLDREAGP